ncbi:MAG: hypothetical protein HC851_13420 [Acaryochloris sp. RU_4_1]|nr:hypothetical protein [Acaryochloris sp. RU_4_1]NJR56830.1 hypothetical protein [Acaryochloris sp. CRU_2_0]
MISPPLLRRLWQMIDEMPSHSLMRLDDTRLVTGLIEQLEQQLRLREEERKGVEKYLGSHMMLIRDIAESRQYTPCALAV